MLITCPVCGKKVLLTHRRRLAQHMKCRQHCYGSHLTLAQVKTMTESEFATRPEVQKLEKGKR